MTKEKYCDPSCNTTKFYYTEKKEEKRPEKFFGLDDCWSAFAIGVVAALVIVAGIDFFYAQARKLFLANGRSKKDE